MARTKKQRKPLKIVKRLPDGTRILSDGFKLLPSVGTLPNGERQRLADMSAGEREEWERRLMKNLGVRISEVTA